ncbi:hypothetical protein A2737_02165 [Candidatus Nomurabacteria bacterium RIFCSPHIGHO2_01_FULL_41_71]|nr:MAG: hypothetical protein A2737_02165 [Candidatus Nomurabacteria bacterium RIFCSPHIGHO2_01_FULL_41_71]
MDFNTVSIAKILFVSKANTLNLYRTGFRTCFLAKKQCASPKAVLQIRLGNSAGILGTRFARPAFQLLKNRLVRLWCVYSTKSEPIFKICNQWSSPRATRLCAKHRAFQSGKCGERNISERLKCQ